MHSSDSGASLGAPTKPLSSLMGYKAEYLLSDFVAGVVIAALSIPIAMGYANIAGLPAEYGLYASAIAPFLFALVTGTNSIIFGMDSAASAMTGSMLAAVGIALGTGLTIEVMPVLTLFTAAFLLLFALFKAGRVIRLIPVPVMHGFIAGISVTVILTQIPLLIGTSADTSGPFWWDVVNVLGSIPNANIPSLLLSVGSFAAILLIKKFLPKVPSALVVLVAATIVTAMLDLSSQGVETLNAIEAGLPMPVIPNLAAYNPLAVAGAAFAIALVVALESLLCLETFSIKDGIRSNGNRELLSFGIVNAACAFFACPPCSASISRTAAGKSAGGRTQVSAIVAAMVVALVVLLCGPVLRMMPRVTLSAIVVIALIEVCDFHKIARYAKHMRSEFAVFMVACLVVMLLGAIPGIVAGFALALGVALHRKNHKAKEELLGAVPYGKYNVPKCEKRVNPGFNYECFKMEGHLSFLNIDSVIDRLIEQIDEDTEALIIKLSKVESLDTTATDKILQLLEMLYARGIHVKLVRKVRPTNDSYTRFELRTLMHDMKFYPNVRSALVSLRELYDKQDDPQRASDWLNEPESAAPNEGESAVLQIDGEDVDFTILEGDHPVITVISTVERPRKKGSPRILLKGKLTYLQSQKRVLFSALYDSDEKAKSKKWSFERLLMTRESNGEILAEYDDGEWDWAFDKQVLKNAVKVIDAYIRHA